MHSPDETVDEEDVAQQQLSLIKMSGGADSGDEMIKSKACVVVDTCEIFPHNRPNISHHNVY